MPKAVFRNAVDTAEHLEWKAGLGAIKRGEGRGQINAADPDRLLGSAYLDGDCMSAFPNAPRWDYVIGYDRSNEAVAYFIEVHSAETSEVSKVEGSSSTSKEVRSARFQS